MCTIHLKVYKKLKSIEQKIKSRNRQFKKKCRHTWKPTNQAVRRKRKGGGRVNLVTKKTNRAFINIKSILRGVQFRINEQVITLSLLFLHHVPVGEVQLSSKQTFPRSSFPNIKHLRIQPNIMSAHRLAYLLFFVLEYDKTSTPPDVHKAAVN